jgi:gluconate 5-dehydrogenase
MSGEIQLFDLSGKNALVTGGNTGIGLGIAKGLAQAGARVAIVGRDARKNEAALSALARIRPGCRQFIYDLEDAEGIPGCYERVSTEMGGIDVLVNNAGIQSRGRADQVPLTDFERVLRVNLTAPYVLSQSFAKERIEQAAQGGVIIMIASLMSEAARPTTSAYTAAKGGIRQLVRALAVDWAPFGIRVNGIGPGYIRTEMTRPLWEDEAFSQWVVGRTPLARWGLPEDFAGAAVFLTSDAARFITGQILYVDGGWLATF